MGGEKSVLMLRLRLTVGSSPHRRGKVDRGNLLVNIQRITPAQAGRSPYFLYGKKDYKDHPRIGGEKAELTAAVISAMGSPPRRRGKVPAVLQCRRFRGITPAQAGKSQTCPARRSRCRDHPRVGGEKAAKAVANSIKEGSPPHRRGKVGQRHGLTERPGITPA